MESNITEALKLMLVGMSTVLIVLLIIIQAGKLLIKFVNAFVPAEEEAAPAKTQAQAPAAISPAVEKAIAAAVNTLTGGKGRVEKIEKM